MVFILPPRYISLPHLIINNNIKIKGSPGTLLEINNGIIQIKNENIKFVMSECSIVFNLEKKSFLEKVKSDEVLKKNVIYKNDKYYISLFQISNSFNSYIEINDCDFRAVVHEEENLIDDSDKDRFIYETCFDFCSIKDDGNTNSINNMSNNINSNTNILLSSTILTNFYHILKAKGNISVIVDNCHLSESIDYALCVNSINSFQLFNSIIINNYSGINITLENINYDNIIKIKNSNVSQNNKYGININSCMENIKTECDIEIDRCNFENNKSNAIFLENLNIKHLSITDNHFKYNFDNGIVLNKISFTNNKKETDTLNKQYNFDFIKNYINENKNNSGVIFENLSNSMINIQDNKITDCMNGLKFFNIKSSLIKIGNLNVSNCLENGIIIQNIFQSVKFHLCECKLFKNNYYGLFICEDTLNVSKPSLLITNCDISQNRSGGIFLKNYFISLKNNKITENKYAIELPLSDNKNCIKIYDDSDTLITNPIGGSWGEISSSKCVCNSTKCIIF
jgi:hypothetical protein